MTTESMPATTAAIKRPAPPRRGPPGPPAKPPITFARSSGVVRKADKTGLYGPEGIGKSSLAAARPGIIFADLEHSTDDLDIKRDIIEVPGDYAASWLNLRAYVQSLNSGTRCIDSMTRAEDWCAAWVIKNKKSNEGAAAADSLEDFKYKAGLTFVVDEYRRFLADIDNAFLRGVSFVLIAHARVNRIKNPDGSDFIRYEPRLIDDPKGSNMLQFVQFLDHLLFVDLDKNVDNRGKVKGGGSRTIYLDTSPTRLSKARGIPNEPIVFEQGSGQVWELIEAGR